MRGALRDISGSSWRIPEDVRHAHLEFRNIKVRRLP